jgi:hypothetical protein
MDCKAKVEKLVDIYISWLLSTDADAGWHQPRDYRADVHISGGGYDQADIKMINEIVWLREPHALLPLAKSLIGRLKPKHHVPLIVHYRYIGTANPETSRIWTSSAIAAELGISPDQLRHRRRHAVDKMVAWLETVSPG